MFNQPEIPLTMPRLSVASYRDDTNYMAVPMDAVLGAIDVLRAYVAQWDPPEGTQPADQDSNDRAAAAAGALCALLRAHAASTRSGGLHELLQQIDQFFWWGTARAWLEEARASSEHADIAAALIALYDQRLVPLAKPPSP
jgi:hypothetical protein